MVTEKVPAKVKPEISWAAPVDGSLTEKHVVTIARIDVAEVLGIAEFSATLFIAVVFVPEPEGVPVKVTEVPEIIVVHWYEPGFPAGMLTRKRLVPALVKVISPTKLVA